MVNFGNVKSLTIPEGNVTRISSGSKCLWRKMEDDIYIAILKEMAIKKEILPAEEYDCVKEYNKINEDYLAYFGYLSYLSDDLRKNGNTSIYYEHIMKCLGSVYAGTYQDYIDFMDPIPIYSILVSTSCRGVRGLVFLTSGEISSGSYIGGPAVLEEGGGYFVDCDYDMGYDSDGFWRDYIANQMYGLLSGLFYHGGSGDIPKPSNVVYEFNDFTMPTSSEIYGTESDWIDYQLDLYKNLGITETTNTHLLSCSIPSYKRTLLRTGFDGETRIGIAQDGSKVFIEKRDAQSLMFLTMW